MPMNLKVNQNGTTRVQQWDAYFGNYQNSLTKNSLNWREILYGTENMAFCLGLLRSWLLEELTMTILLSLHNAYLHSKYVSFHL